MPNFPGNFGKSKQTDKSLNFKGLMKEKYRDAIKAMDGNW